MRFRVVVLDWKSMSRDERWNCSHGIQPSEKAAAEFEAVIGRGAFKSYEVEAEDRDDVFAILNRAPGREEEVPASYRGERSLSVGDIIIDAAGGMHLCASVGWEDLARVAPAAAEILRRSA